MARRFWRQGDEVFLPLSTDQAAQRTGGRLPGFKPRGDDNAADRNMNLADGDLYLRLQMCIRDREKPQSMARRQRIKLAAFLPEMLFWSLLFQRLTQVHPGEPLK